MVISIGRHERERYKRELCKPFRKLEQKELEEVLYYIDDAISRIAQSDQLKLEYKVVGSQKTGVSRRGKWDLDLHIDMPKTKDYYPGRYLAYKLKEYHPDLFDIYHVDCGSPGEMSHYLVIATIQKGEYSGLRIDFLDDYWLLH